MKTKVYPTDAKVAGPPPLSGASARPVVGGDGLSFPQRIGLIVRSKLLVSSIVLAVVLLGETSYIVVRKTASVKHPSAVTATTARNSKISTSKNQTAGTKQASGSTTPVASSGGSSASTSKSTTSSGTAARGSGSSSGSTSTNTTTTSGGSSSSGGNVCSGNVLEHTATGKTDPLGC